MLNFKTIELEDYELLSSRLKRLNYQLCDYSFAEIFIWKSFYSTEYCIYNDTLFLKQHDKVRNLIYYYPPIGVINRSNFELIALDASANNQKLVIGNIEKTYVDSIYEAAGDDYKLINDRNRSNYIYLSSSLANLSGKRYHGKKNYINRFCKKYGDRYEYRNLYFEDINSVFDFQINWCNSNCHESEIGKLSETCAISTALKNFSKLKLLGGILSVDGKIIAYTLAAEVRDDTLVILIEKANNSFDGAYQMINYLFINANYKNYYYINREEDMGIEGLRKSKLSYHPDYLSESYWLYYKGEDYV